MDWQKCLCILTLTRDVLWLHSNNKVISIHEMGGGGCFDKEQEFHGSWCCISWGKRDKVIGPLLIKHKI